MTVTRKIQGRPSLRKLAEASHLKQVTWSPVEAQSETCRHYLDPSTMQHLWYTRQELREMRIANEMLVSSHESVNHDIQEEDVLRGLESWTDHGSWKRFEHHRDCLNKVLDEQDRQRGIDKTEFQNSAYPIVKRINHMHIPFDHERLAALSRDATAKARRAALLRGKMDQLEVNGDQQTIQKVHSTSKTGDCDRTIDTELLTTDSSTTTTDGRLEIPRTISVSLSSQEKQKKRFAAYLANRNERVAAREKAEYEWEQRRLQRKAVIREEVDSSIDQLQRIVNLSSQLCEIVAASDIRR